MSYTDVLFRCPKKYPTTEIKGGSTEYKTKVETVCCDGYIETPPNCKSKLT